MKALKLGLLFISIGVLLTFSNCGGGGSTPEPLADQQFTKLSKTWNIATVTLEGQDQKTLLYPNFKLQITGTKGAASFGYKTTGNPAAGSPWKGTSTWAFGTDPLTMLVREPDTDKLAMTYAVSASTLQISFNYTGTVNQNQGRTEVVTGNWIFTFTPAP